MNSFPLKDRYCFNYVPYSLASCMLHNFNQMSCIVSILTLEKVISVLYRVLQTYTFTCVWIFMSAYIYTHIFVYICLFKYVSVLLSSYSLQWGPKTKLILKSSRLWSWAWESTGVQNCQLSFCCAGPSSAANWLAQPPRKITTSSERWSLQLLVQHLSVLCLAAQDMYQKLSYFPRPFLTDLSFACAVFSC